jgi:hypothetical protein
VQFRVAWRRLPLRGATSHETTGDPAAALTAGSTRVACVAGARLPSGGMIQINEIAAVVVSLGTIAACAARQFILPLS